MRQTLFRIPVDGPWLPGEWPGFGFGILLALWVAVAAYWLWRNRRDLRWSGDLIVAAGLWCIIAAVIVLLPSVLPWFSGLNSVIATTSAALERNPREIDALLARAEAYAKIRQYQKATTDLRTATAIDPRQAEAHNRLASILATAPDESIRNGEEAVAHATAACELSGDRDAQCLSTLAAAQAEVGRFDEAVATAERAAALAWESNEPSQHDQIPLLRERLRLYQTHRPYRDKTAGWSMPVYGYGFMLFLGFTTAGWAATRRAAIVNIHADVIWDLALWLFIGGLFGARAYYCVQYSDRVFFNKVGDAHVLKSLPQLITSAVNLPDGGLVLYGGLLMGAVAYFIFCRRRKQNPLLLADVVIPSVFIGVAFGRIGCFLNGCCYGDRCTLPWGVTFPLGSVPDAALVSRGFIAADQPFSLTLHPTQLYSSLDAVILAFLTHTYFRYRHRNGSVLALGLLTYPITRFAIELLRGDELGQFNTPLTTAQLVSIGLFITGLVYSAWLARRPAAA